MKVAAEPLVKMSAPARIPAGERRGIYPSNFLSQRKKRLIPSQGERNKTYPYGPRGRGTRLCYRTDVPYAPNLPHFSGFSFHAFGALGLFATGFMVAFLHTALPTHWLPFVAAGRLRHWGLFKLLCIAMVSALCHVVTTALIGAVLTGLGLALQETIGGAFVWVAAGVMIGVGGGLTFHALRRGGHHHGASHRGFSSDRAAIASLMLLMTLSPCEAFLPIYLADVRLGWMVFGLLTLTLGAATVCGMCLFILLGRLGMTVLRLERYERDEGAVIGLALIMLGVAALVIER